jgi:hypothetical protein
MAEWKLATSLRRLLGRSVLEDTSAAETTPIASPKGDCAVRAQLFKP